MKGKVIAEWLDNPKRLIAAAIIIVIAIVIIAIFGKKIKNWITDLKQQRDLEKDNDKLIEATGQTPSYADVQYRQWADKLYVAMKGAGTDEDAIDNIMAQMRNDADVLKLVSAFGIRDSEDLYQWIDGEYWGEPSCNKILRKNGITILF